MAAWRGAPVPGPDQLFNTRHTGITAIQELIRSLQAAKYLQRKKRLR
jgi:hypothetical protein